jgi:hypothetical protein
LPRISQAIDELPEVRRKPELLEESVEATVPARASESDLVAVVLEVAVEVVASSFDFDFFLHATGPAAAIAAIAIRPSALLELPFRMMSPPFV